MVIDRRGGIYKAVGPLPDTGACPSMGSGDVG